MGWIILMRLIMPAVCPSGLYYPLSVGYPSGVCWMGLVNLAILVVYVILAIFSGAAYRIGLR